MAELCGAKTRSGGRCRKPAMPNGRCRLHGGLSTGPKDQAGNQNAALHGIYSRHLTDEENEYGKSLKLGTVEDELRLCRIRVCRALDAETRSAGKPELEETVKRDISTDIGARTEKRWRVRDYSGVIDKILGRIESLERTRLLLRIELGLTDDELNADALTPGEPDEEPPAKPIR